MQRLTILPILVASFAAASLLPCRAWAQDGSRQATEVAPESPAEQGSAEAGDGSSPLAEEAAAEEQAPGGESPSERELVSEESPAEGAPEGEGAAAGEEPEEETAEPLGGDEAQRAEAREHIDRAFVRYEAEDWDGALAEFQRAYEVLEGHPSQPLLLYNIGLCREHLFQYGRAMEAFRQYLERAGAEAADRDEVAGKVQLLEGLLATIHIEVNVAEYEVWVDEQRIGGGVRELAVPGGTHVVEVRAAGYESEQREIQLPARTERRLVVELEEEFRGVSQAYFWSSAALAVAALTAGIVFGVQAMNEHDRVSEQLRHPAEQWLLTQDDVDHITRLALTADILYGVAGVFAVSAAVLAFLTDWGRARGERSEGEADETSRSTLVVGFGGDAVSVGVRGVF